jgi:hypothetical protein
MDALIEELESQDQNIDEEEDEEVSAGAGKSLHAVTLECPAS